MLVYTRIRSDEPREVPDWDELESLLEQDLYEEFIRRILEWKGEANYEYFRDRWDLRPDEITNAATSLEDVEIKDENIQ
jgi:hypothetical protein